MKFNLSVKKVNERTEEVVSNENIVTEDWDDIENYWESSGIEDYEDIEHLLKDLTDKGEYNLFCNTDFIYGDGLIVYIKASIEDK